MDPGGSQLLAGSPLSNNHHRPLNGRHPGNLLLEGDKCLRLTHSPIHGYMVMLHEFVRICISHAVAAPLKKIWLTIQ
jgi:hypothetical protein